VPAIAVARAQKIPIKTAVRVKTRAVRHARAATQMFIAGSRGDERVDLLFGIDRHSQRCPQSSI
jgi:hypothetical protein